VAAKGEDAPECDKFAKYYRSLCPGEWVCIYWFHQIYILSLLLVIVLRLEKNFLRHVNYAFRVDTQLSIHFTAALFFKKNNDVLAV
jgi:hypothetical protein